MRWNLKTWFIYCDAKKQGRKLRKKWSEMRSEVRSQSTAMHAPVGGLDVQANQQSGDFIIQAEMPPSSETSSNNNNSPTPPHNNNSENNIDDQVCIPYLSLSYSLCNCVSFSLQRRFFVFVLLIVLKTTRPHLSPSSLDLYICVYMLPSPLIYLLLNPRDRSEVV